MKASDFSRYISDPASMGPETVDELSRLVEQFPYFQPAHILLTLSARRWDAALYQKTLKRTAIVVTDRSRLFELLSAMETSGTETAALSTQSGLPAPDNAPQAAQDEPVNDIVLLKAAEQKADLAAEPANTEDAAGMEKLETEIGRQAVTAFVEKEVLKIPGAHKPAAASAPSPNSFGDWLAYMKKNNGQSWQQLEEEVRKEKTSPGQEAQSHITEERARRNRAIIDNIIEKNPGHIRTKEETKFYNPESRARESLLENEHLVTETLAKIYALQGNTTKAIRAYQILSLKYPQKSAYFAGLIENLKNHKTE